jgi:hypothetical protein
MTSIDKFEDHCWKDVIPEAELTHKVNLFDLHHKYADVMHLDEIVAHLDGMRMGRAAE